MCVCVCVCLCVHVYYKIIIVIIMICNTVIPSLQAVASIQAIIVPTLTATLTTVATVV